MPHRVILKGLIIVFVLIMIGTLVYPGIEGWSYLDSFYFTAMTLTTIGFGDIVPVTDIGKIFTVFFSIGGVAIVLFVLSGMLGKYFMHQASTNRTIYRRLLPKKKRWKGSML